MRRSGQGIVRLGFVPLVDAAPLIVAHERGFFADEGLRVELERQIGWGNVRDKLVYGHLHASHALLGMPVASVVGQDRFSDPLVSIMGLSVGGNAITLSRRLIDAGIRTAADIARLPSGRNQRPLEIAHVFGCSTHHYMLRDWLAQGGVDPDRNVRLAVLPPPQMTRQMAQGHLDGFCVGEPWNTLAESEGLGAIVASTNQLLPGHPEKVLAVSRRWLEKHADEGTALIRAILRTVEILSDPREIRDVAAILSKQIYLDLPADLLAKSLQSGMWRVPPAADLFPSATHAAWLLELMRRWGHLAAGVNVTTTAMASMDATEFRRAAATLNVDCPPDDMPPMKLRDGWLELGNSLPATLRKTTRNPTEGDRVPTLKTSF